MEKHKHNWKSIEPGYGGYSCRCGAWSSVKNPKKSEICLEGVNDNR